jgi:hypothetical protein
MVDTEKAFQTYETMKTLLEFSSDDAAELVKMADLVDRHGPTITDHFYSSLAKFPETAKQIEGRVDSLKATHKAWMKSLVAGEYGRPYFDARWRIGLAHVRIGLDPFWVESVMSLIRSHMGTAIANESSDPAQAGRRLAAFTKICDLDLLVINLSYGEDRLDRLTEFTGMKRNLIENIIRIPRKAG